MEIFTTDDQDRIVQAISVAESKTSGEIRLVIDKKLAWPSAIDAAIAYFQKLEMHKTVLKNGVLIYLSTDDHQLAIIGDRGIHTKVGNDFWDDTKEQMIAYFKKGEMAQGLIVGIQHIGEQLNTFFPRRDDDINELPDDIYFGKH